MVVATLLLNPLHDGFLVVSNVKDNKVDSRQYVAVLEVLNVIFTRNNYFADEKNLNGTH